MRLPNNSQRITLYGQTGSGKTVAELWHLEQRDFTRRPWFLFDYKGDPTIKRIPRMTEVSISDDPPKQPGLYVVRPFPGDDVEPFLWKIWDRGRTGLAIDEVYMLGRFNKAYNAIMTQGRAKSIPVIAATQRPSWLSPFQMSESDFHQVFHLTRPTDIKAIREWLPGMGETRRDYTSYYYDVGRDTLERCAPVPDEDTILNRFDLKMPRRIDHFGGLLTNANPKRKRA